MELEAADKEFDEPDIFSRKARVYVPVVPMKQSPRKSLRDHRLQAVNCPGVQILYFLSVILLGMWTRSHD